MGGTRQERKQRAIRAVADAVRRYEQAWAPHETALRRVLDERDTAAAQDSRVAGDELAAAASALIDARWEAATTYARLGDVLYEVARADPAESNGGFRIRRVDLRREAGDVLDPDDEGDEPTPAL